MTAALDVTAGLAELCECPQWVLWRGEERDGKVTKVPYCSHDPSRRASTSDPHTWGSLELADLAVELSDDLDGRGFVFAADDPYTGLDFDHCIDLATGAVHPFVARVIKEVGGYQERSPSDTGIHVILAAELRSERHRTDATPWGSRFEAYDQRQFFTITGANASGDPFDGDQEALDALIGELLPAQPQANSRASTDRARPASAHSGAGRSPQRLLKRYPRLARIASRKRRPPGDGSPSAWDFHLACEALRTGRPPITEEEAVELLAHARAMHPDEKRKDERPDYLRLTVQKALAEAFR